jgi:hypothetical protein
MKFMLLIVMLALVFTVDAKLASWKIMALMYQDYYNAMLYKQIAYYALIYPLSTAICNKALL